jgi:hypothetical protein
MVGALFSWNSIAIPLSCSRGNRNFVDNVFQEVGGILSPEPVFFPENQSMGENRAHQ